MFKIIIIIFFFLNLSSKVFAEFNKSDPYTLEIYVLYDECVDKFKKPHRLTINYDLEDYANLSEYFRLSTLKCNFTSDIIERKKYTYKTKIEKIQNTYKHKFNSIYI